MYKVNYSVDNFPTHRMAGALSDNSSLCVIVYTCVCVSLCVTLCVCVCVWVRERERERERAPVIRPYQF